MTGAQQIGKLLADGSEACHFGGCQVHISNFSMQPLLCRPAKGHGIVDALLTKVLSVLIPMSMVVCSEMS